MPFSGEKELLNLQPSKKILWTYNVEIIENNIRFEIINFNNDSQKIIKKSEEIFRKIEKQRENVGKEVEKYNASLEEFANQLFTSRKSQLIQQENLLQSLNIPIKKASEVPETFKIPVVKKNLIIKPDRSNNSFRPEPTLDYNNYQQILKVIHEMGKEIERHPGVYENIKEEILRDYFLITLSPNFEYAGGETFNKSVKTNILIRHENKNVFIAECLIWKGIKNFYDKINQCLSYLTWRDSKSAMICFIQNKELSEVLDKIEKKTSNHKYFIKNNGKKDESWFQFEFSLQEDRSRIVHLAVLCFHFPKVSKK